MHDWSVAVFVRNEQARIAQCIDAISDELAGRNAAVTIVVNGTTDDTENEIRRATRGKTIPIRSYRIAFGDKANAWNAFIHRLRPAAATYFFVDGYAVVANGSLKLLSDALTNTDAIASTAIPTIGRSAAREAAYMRQHGGALQGSLHALRGTFVDQIAARAIRQPIGTYRVDGLVGAMALQQLAPELRIWDKSKIALVDQASWAVSEKSLFNIRDVKRHFNRLIQQARGRLQNSLIRDIVLSSGYESLPRFIDPAVVDWIGKDPASRRPKDLFGRLALQRMKNCVVPDESLLEPEPIDALTRQVPG